MTVNDGCDTSTIFEWKRIKKSETPPRRGRAAAGGSITAPGTAEGGEQRTQPKGTKWVAVTYLGGPECRYRLQCGKEVRYVSGVLALVDVLSFLREEKRPRRGR